MIHTPRYRLVLDELRAPSVRPASELFELYCIKLNIVGPSARIIFGLLVYDLAHAGLIEYSRLDTHEPDFPWDQISLTPEGREWLQKHPPLQSDIKK